MIEKLRNLTLLSTTLLFSWATAWLDLLKRTGLSHPSFEQYNYRIALAVGMASVLFMFFLWSKRSLTYKRTISKRCFLVFFILLVVCFMFGKLIDYVERRDEVETLRLVWSFTALSLSISYVIAIGSLGLMLTKEDVAAPEAEH